MVKIITTILLTVATNNAHVFEVEQTPKVAFEQICDKYNVSNHEKEKWDYIITKESNWQPNITNTSSGAYGLGQALPKEKILAYGDNIQSPIVQLEWMYNYMINRYGSISNAYKHHLTRGWY